MPVDWSFAHHALRRAIVFADLVESVRLFHLHPDLIDTWRSYAVQVREGLAPRHGGRLVRTAGDGLLLVFDSASQAAQAAFAMHAALAGQQACEPVGRQLWLRIGLHVDDVVVDEHELWGGGVNLAARVASQAQPGQTTATASACDLLSDGVQATIEDLGQRYLKNLPDPLRVFQLRPPGQTMPRGLRSSDDLRPAVAVIPFEALPHDPEHDALGHAMADDIIACLSRHPGLRVLSRLSTSAVRGQALDIPSLRRLLGASFLLSGRFFARGGRVRLSAELCELEGGQVLWAGQLGGEIDALFEGVDDLVPQLVALVAEHVAARELMRVRALPMDSLASYSLLLGANGLLNSLARPEFERARELLEHLCERHPRQAAPQAQLSLWHTLQVLQGWTGDPAGTCQQALGAAQRAVDNDPDSPDALVALGVAKVFTERDFGAAERLYLRALAADPHHASAWARLSECQSVARQFEMAMTSAQRAIDRSPLDPQRYIFEAYAARSAYQMRDFVAAAGHAAASVRRHALHAPSHRLLVASLWMQGEHEQARAAAATFRRLLPHAKATDGPSDSARDPATNPFVQALHQAGIPL
jgi:class 3 adenylate cyclase/tetratricopeptide (TPR) repeat protein